MGDVGRVFSAFLWDFGLPFSKEQAGRMGSVGRISATFGPKILRHEKKSRLFEMLKCLVFSCFFILGKSYPTQKAMCKLALFF